MYKKFEKIKFKIRKIYYNFYSNIKKKKRNKYIAIISCDKYCGKIREDIDLKYYLNKNNINADIISWKANVDFNKYDGLIIRTIWDFQDNLDNFLKWLENIKTPVFNDIDLIKNNIDKESQYTLMEKYNIKHIPTKFINPNELNIKDIHNNYFQDYKKLILKPSISESGKNTYLIDNNQIPNIDLNKINSKIMVQPFLEDIKYGEYSVIFFNHKYSHCVIRYPGILSNRKPTETTNIDDKLLKICNKIESIKEYKQYLFLRLDFIKHNNEYLLLETELIDPMLFINKSNNPKLIYQNFIKEIEKKLQ